MSVTVFIWFDPAPIDRDRPAGKSQSTGGFDLSEMNGFVFLLVIWQSNGKVEQFMWPSWVTHATKICILLSGRFVAGFNTWSPITPHRFRLVDDVMSFLLDR